MSLQLVTMKINEVQKCFSALCFYYKTNTMEIIQIMHKIKHHLGFTCILHN